MKYILEVLVLVFFFSGCAVKQHINLDHKVNDKQPVEVINKAVEVSVNDYRDYIVSGKKEKSFIGFYRGGFGNPWDVNTKNKIPLEDVFKNDLADELVSLGFIEKGGSKSLVVNINKWKFDTYQNIKFNYDLDIKVVDSRKTILIEDKIAETLNIRGSFWTGPKGAAEREIPKLYTQIIEQILRENRGVLKALKED